MIFFRDQEMSHDAHKDFGRKFGNLGHPLGRAGPARPSRDRRHPRRRQFQVRGGRELALGPDLRLPSRRVGSILYMKVLPDDGGDTCFASMYVGL